MSVKNWQPTPRIIVEDVDHQEQLRQECQSPPSYNFTPRNSLTNSPSSPSSCTMITPEVDAYVTPLSLCQPYTPRVSPSIPAKEKVMVVSGGSIPPCLATSGSESSFTSVDIGGPFHPTVRSTAADNDSTWNSWCDTSQQASSTGCFDLKSGLMCVTRAITGSIAESREKCDHHRVDMSETSIELHNVKPLRQELALKKKMSLCSKLGIFFICIAIIGLIAIGIAMYVEFVTKPTSAARSKQPILNETTICDYLLSSCENRTTPMAIELTSTNHTGVPNESGKVEAQFTNTFINQLTSKLPN